MAGCSSAGEMVMMGYCCRSSSLSHSGVRGKMERGRERRREPGTLQLFGGGSTHSNWPPGYGSLKNENAVIVLIRYKVFLNIYCVCLYFS